MRSSGPRVGPMRDIVATIQPEQDELVRADLDVSICVQGAPGTGKTAVGLHRAAYLLYLHRERMRRAGVLIVGPNTGVPALHRGRAAGARRDRRGAGDRRATWSRRRRPAPRRTAVAAVKHDARMAEVLRARAVSPASASRSEPIDGLRTGRSAGGSRSTRCAASSTTYAERIRRTGSAGSGSAPGWSSLLQRQAEARRATRPSDAWLRRMGRAKPVTAFLDAAWPAVTAEALVVLAARRRRACCREPRTACSPPTEQAAIALGRRRRARQGGQVDGGGRGADRRGGRPDRAARRLRAHRGRRGAGPLADAVPGDRPAQRARRRSPCSATSPRAPPRGPPGTGGTPWPTWASRAPRWSPLTVGFRVPAVVLALANRLLPALDVNVPAATSLRHDGELTVTRADDLTAAHGRRGALGARRIEGSVGVIAADVRVPTGSPPALAAAGVAHRRRRARRRVSVLPATVAKGLEYDHVMVVEPAEIVAAEPRGLQPPLRRAHPCGVPAGHRPRPAVAGART